MLLLQSGSQKYPESRSQRFHETGAGTFSPTAIKNTVQRVDNHNMRMRGAAVCERTKTFSCWILFQNKAVWCVERLLNDVQANYPVM